MTFFKRQLDVSDSQVRGSLVVKWMKSERRENWFMYFKLQMKGLKIPASSYILETTTLKV